MVVEVRERSQVAEARWRALDAAARAGLGESGAARLGLIATEAATNLLKHAGGGEILVAPCPASGTAGVDLVAIDRGPGMGNVAQCLADGFSSTGSAGSGLGAIRRQADRFDVFSAPDTGTVLVATVTVRPRPERPPSLWVEGLVVPKPGETVSGDGWYERRSPGRTTILVCDGLGHGIRAAAVTQRAGEAFFAFRGDDIEAWMAAVNDSLRATRGAALALATLDCDARMVRFTGVGNISGWLRSTCGEQRTLSVEGIAGRDGWRAKPMDYPFEGSLLAIFATDGLATRWDLGRYRGLAARDPLTIAAVLYRDFRRVRDDCAVVVARCGAP